MKTYEDWEYAHSRLKDTMVRLTDGTPIVVRDLDRHGNVYYVDHADAEESKICKLSSLNIDPVPLGYLNISLTSLYLTRLPMRQDWKQGLRMNSLRTADGKKPNINLFNVIPVVRGSYPNLKEAIGKITKTDNKNPFNANARPPSSVAFSRNFALRATDKLVEYKGTLVIGTWDDDGRIKLKDRFSWVEDELKLVA